MDSRNIYTILVISALVIAIFIIDAISSGHIVPTFNSDEKFSRMTIDPQNTNSVVATMVKEANNTGENVE